MNRRQALKLLSLALASGALSCLGQKTKGTVSLQLAEKVSLSSITEQTTSAVKLGKDYLRRYSEDGLQEFEKNLQQVQLSNLANFLATKSKQDFANGDSLIVGGFLLSVTEGRFLATIARAVDSDSSSLPAAGN